MPEGSRLRHAVRAGGGVLVAALLGAALVLAVIAGLPAYLESIEDNTRYANGLLHSDGTLSRMREHFDIVLEYFRAAGRWQLPAALLVVAAVVGLVVVSWTRFLRPLRVLASTTAVTLMLTLVTLALTAYWVHHLQMLAYPATLMERRSSRLWLRSSVRAQEPSEQPCASPSRSGRR